MKYAFEFRKRNTSALITEIREFNVWGSPDRVRAAAYIYAQKRCKMEGLKLCKMVPMKEE